MIRKFASNERGNFAVMGALLALPLVFAVGAGVDLTRLNAASSNLQDIADAGALAMAISKEQNWERLRAIGEDAIEGNTARSVLRDVAIGDLSSSEQQVNLSLTATVPTTFMAIAGYDSFAIGASAIAKREVTGSIEVAMVLDNTYSMKGPGTSGRKLTALKGAASDLVNTLIESGEGQVRVALVPYADYVNVGEQYRTASWVKIEERRAQKCETQTTETVCKSRAPTYSCTKTQDGIPYSSTCGGECTRQETVTLDPPRTRCDAPDRRQWFGCVGTRYQAANPPHNLNDANPHVPYPGIIENEIKCPNPIVPLTTDRSELLQALRDMVVEKPYYQPLTYIPSGLIWGQNVLSSTPPFEEAMDYDPRNRRPRKILILMTDGANTMMHQTWWGRHGPLRGGENPSPSMSSGDKKARAEEEKKTNDDSLALCEHIKSKNTEIFTVAFMVDTDQGRALMQNCASSPENYFDATDEGALREAFENIGESISRVRLSRE